MEFELFRLPSGIKCILKRTPNEVVYSALMIDAGTRDETEKEHGLAHLIEHTFFKGTLHRKPYHINSLLDNVGGELNAYTTKEETVIHATTLRQDFAKAADLISDVCFHSVFPQSEIDKELGVIIDEINSYKDSPSESIFDDFEDLLFKGSSLGRNILGTPRSLRKFRTPHLLDFTHRNYATDRMVFAVSGNVSPKRFRSVCEKYFGSVPANERVGGRAELPVYEPVYSEVKKNTFQTHTIIGARAYRFDDRKRIPLALLINMLGGPSSNSRLNLVLREKYGLTYGVEANFSVYSDTGTASVYFSSEKENTARCMELIHKEIDSLRNNLLSGLALSRAKKQLIGQLAVSADNREGYLLNCAKSFLMFDEIDSVEKTNNKITAITPQQICEAANEIFDSQRLSTLIYK